MRSGGATRGKGECNVNLALSAVMAMAATMPAMRWNKAGLNGTEQNENP
jgi:hypothetical protein